MSTALKFLLPVILIALGSVAGVVIVKSKKEVNQKPPEVIPPLIRSTTVKKQTKFLDVSVHGTVRPHTDSTDSRTGKTESNS